MNSRNEKTKQFIMELIGFIVPILGFGMWLYYKNTNPERAKGIAQWSVLGFITDIALSVGRVFIGALF